MLRWSIATVCMGGALEAKLAAAAKAGFRAVEIFENDLTFFSGKPREARAMAADLGLEIVALQPMRDFEAMPDPVRARNFERAARKFELMHELGAPPALPVLECRRGGDRRPRARGRRISPNSPTSPASTGSAIGYEALAWGRHVKDWTAAWDIVRKADRPNLGIVLDSFHACVRGNPIAPIADLPADRIALVQVADAPAIQMDPLSLSRHYRCYPGQGDYPDRRISRRGDARGLSRPDLAGDFQRPVPRRLGGRHRARRHARAARRRGAARRPARAARRRRRSPTCRRWRPRRAWRASPSSNSRPARTITRRFAALLEGLGFRLAARHRSKDVDLYRQGGIAIVVNREREGFAHSFNMLHGPSVCALALRVDSAWRARSSGRGAMECPTYFGKIGPGEALIPAVGGVEGSLIYFIDAGAARSGERDFLAAPGAAEGALRAVDHLSNVVRRSEFLTWSLFYKSVLGLRLEPQVEIADPHGAFFSRSLRSPGGDLRIALNVSEGGATGVTRFLDAFGGAGYQQIALSTDDIFAAVEAARARGVAFLAIPDNYYDDLAARFDIAPDLLARMRALGVLYDRVKDGEFLHIYSRTFRDRFFFEIVQRRDYDLFGAANTPARLAAQARAQDDEDGLRRDFGL